MSGFGTYSEFQTKPYGHKTIGFGTHTHLDLESAPSYGFGIQNHLDLECRPIIWAWTRIEYMGFGAFVDDGPARISRINI